MIRRALLLTLAGGITIVMLFSGCYVLVDLLAFDEGSDTVRVEAVPTVELDTDGGGTVRVVGDAEPGAGIRVDFRWREGMRDHRARAEVVGDVLRVRTACPQNLTFLCRVSATVHVPAGTTVTGGGNSTVEVVDVGGPVTLAVDNGAVRVSGAVGTVRVDGDNGTVEVDRQRGPLVVRTDNGSIRARDVVADRIEASTSNGRISLDLAEAPDDLALSARTSNGSITVLVPADGTPWSVATNTDNGGVENLLDTSGPATRTLDARTDNGSISLRYRAAS